MESNLVKKVKKCMAQNMPKFIVSLLIMSIFTSLLMAFTMVPMANAIAATQISIPSMLTTIAIILVTFSLQYVLQYGFFVLVFLLYSERYAVLGHLFSGFRDFKRSFLLGLIFAAIYVAVLTIVTIILNLLLAYGVIQLHFELLVLILFIVAIVTLAILYMYFAFAWFILYENSRITVRGALKRSFSITKGKKASFVALCLQCSSFFLPLVLVSLVCLQIPLFVPVIDVNSSLYTILAPILNFGYIIGAFVTIMRYSIAFSAWYVSYYESPNVIKEIDQRIIRLPDYHDVTKPNNDSE